MLLPLGAGIGLWCVWVFAVYGHGTPIPLDPPRRLVVHGLYRHVRNPMGMGVLLAVAGWALLFQSWTVLLYGVGLGIFLHLFIVLIEEPTLRRSFGDDYVQYCRQVHRWLPR
jgi:protein-S-isoprenylcysteine O-methyltransferase Ste14